MSFGLSLEMIDKPQHVHETVVYRPPPDESNASHLTYRNVFASDSGRTWASSQYLQVVKDQHAPKMDPLEVSREEVKHLHERMNTCNRFEVSMDKSAAHMAPVLENAAQSTSDPWEQFATRRLNSYLTRRS